MTNEIQFYYENAKRYLTNQQTYFDKLIELCKLKKETISMHKDWYKNEEEKIETLDKLKQLKMTENDYKERKLKKEMKIKQINENISKLRKTTEKKKLDS